jgi:predicted regulator of Ras-like GTPase activity (Roadblock/LC7/MglB family)
MSMLKKLFGNKADSEKLLDQAYLERLLAEVALATPEVEWIALVKTNGLFVSSFPSKPKDTDTIAAMSAAMASLGERIASELKGGDMQYTLIAGTKQISMTIELSSKYLLTIGLKTNVSIQEFLSRMQETSLPLLTKNLHTEDIPRLSGIP